MTTRDSTKTIRNDSGLLDSDQTGTPELPEVSQPAQQDRVAIYREVHKPSIDRGIEEPSAVVSSDSERLRNHVQRIARNAWMAFKDACDSDEPDQQESNYLAAQSSLDELWNDAKHRNIAFRDLLGILTAATKFTPLEAFNQTQRGVLRDAFYELHSWPLSYDTVMGHIEKFAERDIDITGPIRKSPAKKLKVTIEEVE